MEKDYYQILGLNRRATQAEIKKAYRKLARKYHPDLNPGDKAAENRFKEIQEAYSVLSDPKKKSQYDQFGFVGNIPPGGAEDRGFTSGFEGFDFSSYGTSSFGDFFDSIFGTPTQKARVAPQKGEDLHYTMKIGFEDAVHGVQTRIRLNRMVHCSNCQGRGYLQGGERTCPSCSGRGVSHFQRGFMKFSTSCSSCEGTGVIRGNDCPNCRGEGLVPFQELINVRIPAGVDTGSKVRIPGKGNDGINGGPPGDLYISIEVNSHPFFKREGDNIYLKIPITISEATLGAKIEVPTLYGRKTIRIPPGTKSGQKFRLKETGVQRPGKRGKGDQFVEVTIIPPPFEDQRVRELMKELERISPQNPRENLEGHK